MAINIWILQMYSSRKARIGQVSIVRTPLFCKVGFSSRKLECGISIGIRRINDWLKALSILNSRSKGKMQNSRNLITRRNDTGVVADTNGVHAIWFILFLEQGDNNGIALHRFDSKDLPRQHGIDFELHVIASEIREKIGEYQEKHPCS
ncbi:hypothetical protein Scep_004587 [Stephania cephalantha]|uniref:Uncharacterized protein n=1 Tax=Stephania cephalantha TaxID=152367 RepID=A0AAP0KU52_9MAGN